VTTPFLGREVVVLIDLMFLSVSTLGAGVVEIQRGSRALGSEKCCSGRTSISSIDLLDPATFPRAPATASWAASARFGHSAADEARGFDRPSRRTSCCEIVAISDPRTGSLESAMAFCP